MGNQILLDWALDKKISPISKEGEELLKEFVNGKHALKLTQIYMKSFK